MNRKSVTDYLALQEKFEAAKIEFFEEIQNALTTINKEYPIEDFCDDNNCYCHIPNEFKTVEFEDDIVSITWPVCKDEEIVGETTFNIPIDALASEGTVKTYARLRAIDKKEGKLQEKEYIIGK